MILYTPKKYTITLKRCNHYIIALIKRPEYNFQLTDDCWKCSCSVAGSVALCYHASEPGSIPFGGHTNSSPYLLELLGQLSLPSF